ncbi:MAG: hypothetical protein ACYDAK_11380 [Candidatus Limnocylindrales bacterium]
MLEDAFELLVVNAAHIKAVPGRKADVRDAEWIADLLCHGPLRASFVPSPPGTGAARADPLPLGVEPGAGPRRSTGPEGPGGSEHQARLGRLRGGGRLGSGHPAGADRGLGGSGGPRARSHAGQAVRPSRRRSRGGLAAIRGSPWA